MCNTEKYEEFDDLPEDLKKKYNCSNYVVIDKYLHRQFHLKYGCGNNTQEQWCEFISSYVI